MSYPSKVKCDVCDHVWLWTPKDYYCPECGHGRKIDKTVREPDCTSPSGSHEVDLDSEKCVHCGEKFYIISETVMEKLLSDLPYTAQLEPRNPQNTN